MMFLLMLLIGLRSSRFPTLKVIDVVNPAIAIAARLLLKLPAIVERARDGSLRISPRLISPWPVVTIEDEASPANGFDIGTDVCVKSAAPVMKPTGEVPATPSVSIDA